MSTPEHRPTRAGLARMIFGSGRIGLLKPFEYRPLPGSDVDLTEQLLIGASLLFSEEPSRSESVIITNT